MPQILFPRILDTKIQTVPKEYVFWGLLNNLHFVPPPLPNLKTKIRQVRPTKTFEIYSIALDSKRLTTFAL